jgi:hypothetical protein
VIERRKKDTSIPGGKRDDDPSVELAASYGLWAKLIVEHRAKLWTVCMLAATVLGWLLNAAMLGKRVVALERTVSVLSVDVTHLKNSEDTKMYILCTLLRRTDRDAVPRECTTQPAPPMSPTPPPL